MQKFCFVGGEWVGVGVCINEVAKSITVKSTARLVDTFSLDESMNEVRRSPSSCHAIIKFDLSAVNIS